MASLEVEGPQDEGLGRRTGVTCCGVCCAIILSVPLCYMLIPLGWSTVAEDSYQYADLLVTGAVDCMNTNGQAANVVLANGDGSGIKEGMSDTSSSGVFTDFAKGKVNWLVANQFDTSTLCSSELCQWLSLLRFCYTKRFAAQGGVVLLNGEDEVVGVLSVAGNPSQLDDRKCAREGAVAANFRAKDDKQLEYYEPARGAQVVV